jgi:hypothetical protein
MLEQSSAPSYSYEACLQVSERVNWRVEDLIGGEKRLDFSRAFLPEALARVEPLEFLTPVERLALNQIRAHGYLYMFGLVEEFILPFVLDHARPSLQQDDYRTRALLQFASEEAKHIQLFKRFREDFLAGFGSHCEVIGPPEAVATAVLSHDPLAVAITILHIEWMTQAHYVESVREDRTLDPQFKSLLKHHWLEEAQHAKLDTLMVESLAAERGEAERASAVGEYLEIGGFLDQGLQKQVELDLESFERATSRRLTAAERDRFVAVQLQAQRFTFLGSGMSHPNVLATLGRLGPELRQQIAAVAPAFA